MKKEVYLVEIYSSKSELVKALGCLSSDPIMRQDRIITQKEAAKLRGVKRQRINQLVNEGRLRSTKIGNQIMVLREDVLNVSVRKYVKKMNY